MAFTRGSIGRREGIGSNPELQSFLVRLGVWTFGVLYVLATAATESRQVDLRSFLFLVAIFAAIYLGLFASLFRHPEWAWRRYITISLDIVAISLGIFFTQTVTPFNLLYIWTFISAGTRFGIGPLVVATLEAVVAYALLMVALDQWGEHGHEALFFLFLLVLLPMYQYALLRQVQRAKDEAERANRAKGDFLAFMTHELRTPLTGVVGMSDLLKTTRLDAEQRDYVQAIANSAQVLSALIGDILDLSKIDAARLRLEQAPFDLRSLVRELCAALGAQALAKGVEMICAVAPEVPATLVGDQLRVRQILFNLVGNAVKFTESGEVALRVAPRPAEEGMDVPHLLLEVVDTGIGIPRAKLPHIFERFSQADDSTTRRYGGSGLGTTIASELTHLMGGIMGAESVEGEGSRFWVRLPLLGEADPGPIGPERRLAGRHGLVLEPNRTQRELCCAALSAQGAQCRSAGSLDDPAAGLGVDGAPDFLVIGDSPSGLDLEGIRARLVALTGGVCPCLFLTYPARHAPGPPGGAAWLTKPFLPEDLVLAVESLLGLRTPRPPAESGPGIPTGGADPGFPGLRVLVAEDNAIAARVITSFLAKLGCECTLVDDGEQALSAALTGGYGIAIVDLRMPRLDGIELTRRYRALAPARPLPIVALTANASEDVRQACLAAGMDGFLAKPVTPDILRRTLADLVRADGGAEPAA